MDLNIGSVIKRLRMEHSVTQEELAGYLGISYQAISKWENETTMPDITLLPKLAAFFGIKIDELFSVDHDDELERAMEISPMDEEIYTLYRAVRGGDEYKYHSDNDWFIRVCEPIARKNPQNAGLYRLLIEAMISKKYYEKAEELLSIVSFSDEDKYIQQILQGDIELAKGNENKAKEIWGSIPTSNWQGQYEIGERFNRLNDYDKAIECFINAYEIQSSPHVMDMMYSLAFLYKKLGRNYEAKKEWELIKNTLISEYGMSEDHNDVLWAKREIEQL